MAASTALFCTARVPGSSPGSTYQCMGSGFSIRCGVHGFILTCKRCKVEHDLNVLEMENIQKHSGDYTRCEVALLDTATDP